MYFDYLVLLSNQVPNNSQNKQNTAKWNHKQWLNSESVINPLI